MLVERPGEVVTKDELLGNAHFADNQRDKAIYLYQKCLQLDPEFVKAMDGLGVV